MYVHNAAEVVRHGCPHCDRDFTTKNNLITVSRTSKIHGFQISTYGLLQKVAISICGGMSKPKYKKFCGIEQYIFQIFDKMKDGAICQSRLPKRLQSPKYSKDIIDDCFLTVVFIQV